MDHPKTKHARAVACVALGALAACSAPPPTGYFHGRATSDDAGAVFGQDPASVVGAACATATSSAARAPVYMLVVLDGSGSMAQDNKWFAVVPALEAFFDDLERQGDTSFGVGLTVFSDSIDRTGGTGPYDVPDVPIRFVDAAQSSALHARLVGTMPDGLTPTALVLGGQYPVLDAFAPPAPLEPNGKRVLVLMTDGVPNGGAPEQAQCVALAGAERARGTLTFAVGIGNTTPYDPTSYDPLFMGRLAVAGGAANAACSPDEKSDAARMCHLQVTPGGRSAQAIEQDFRAAIDHIRGAALSCEYRLQTTGSAAIDPFKVNVVFTSGTGKSALVPQGAVDGWTYDDPAAPTAVLLHGASCANAKGDPRAKVEIVIGCKTVVK